MSLESAKAFMERLQTDQEFAKQVTECKDSEARMALAVGSGFEFTAEEIVQITKSLSDDELDHVAGGIHAPGFKYHAPGFKYI